MLKVKCSHKSCGEINEINYGEMRADLIGNHFYKFRCKCGKRNLVHYKFEVVAIEDVGKHETTEQIIEKHIIK